MITVDTEGVATATLTYAAHLTYQQVAARAADEIERRGWIAGDLAETQIVDPEWDYGMPISDRYIPVPIDKCRVCAYGAINAVIYGNPLGDIDPADPENHPQHVGEVLAAIADALRPGWQEERSFDGSKLRWGPYFTATKADPAQVITHFNDEQADGGAEVVAKFRAIANTPADSDS